MKVFKTRAEVSGFMATMLSNGRTTGFVPTMGALHQGHISLVQKARQENDMVTASIFVNPIQFNNPDDLKKYPRLIEQDLEMLRSAGCDMVLVPEVEEMYPEPATEKYDFGYLETIMEGAFRPGHFNGVAVVVKRLFDIFRPTRAYFGEKDLQQLRVIQQLVEQIRSDVEIIPCRIVREPDGLAMSSRNLRLPAHLRAKASFIYITLKEAKLLSGKVSPKLLEGYVNSQFQKDPDFRLEYFSVVDYFTLKELNNWAESYLPAGCIAAYLGDIRLIDNMLLLNKD